MSMAPSIEHLQTFLARARNNSVESDEDFPWIREFFPWNGPTCFVVVCYITKFISVKEDHKILSDSIWHLNAIAADLEQGWSKTEPSQVQMKIETISEIFADFFFPEAYKFFSVPKDKSHKSSEILVGFMDFLLQILDAEALVDSDDEQRYAPLERELKFVLAFLGDMPFQCTELEQVDYILTNIEFVANEAGSFIYSYVFPTSPIEANIFYRSIDTLLDKIGVLNENIKEHCIKFSELPVCITPKANAIDSLFIVDSLLEDLENVMYDRYHLGTDENIKDHIKTIHEEMTFARKFLEDIEVVQDAHKDEVTESSVQIRDVAYEAEYLVNSYVVNNIPTWYLNLRLPTVVQKIKLMGIKLQDVKNISNMKVLRVEKDFGNKLSFQAMETSVDEDDNVVVGFEDAKSKIFDDLVRGSKNRQIVSIFGLPGLGKTTVAKRLYHLSFDYFDERAWCVVSQTYQKRNVLIDIFTSLATSKPKSEKPNMEDILEMDNESLCLQIYQSLMGRRYLIVMDDVWNSSVWDDLRRCFPDDTDGSRIILTSRIKDSSPTGSIFHPLHLLSEVQCWDLLEKKVFFEEHCPPQLLGIGKEIAAECRGLPLAVVVIAGVLSKLEKEVSVWKEVKRNLDSYILDDPSGCSKILELSYDYLPNHLKRCFLYFGAFPEDAEIKTQKLIWLWIGEGFIPKQEEKSPEKIAEEYLSNLINRSLVMIEKTRSTGGIKACKIHDLLHDMCLRKADEENFLKSVKEEFSIYEKHQRLSVQSTLNKSKSFGLYCRSFFGYMLDLSPGFSQMPLLKVLDLLSSENLFYELDEIFLPVNLRYLSIRRLPKPVVDKLVNLEILCLLSTEVLKLSYIFKMVKLRHLICKCDIALVNDCDTYQTTNLQSLGSIMIHSQEIQKILRCSPYLLKLKCLCDSPLFPDLQSLTQLESLNITYTDRYEGELSKIYFPSTIKKLTLNGIALPWAEMSIIGRLPNLQCLKLLYEAFVGQEWVTKDGEFQGLRFLTLEESLLEQWTAWSEHFPKLECLVLRKCDKLQEIPSDLGNISTLQIIEVNSSSYEAGMSAVRIEKEQYDYGNEEPKVIINNSEWSKEQLVNECGEE